MGSSDEYCHRWSTHDPRFDRYRIGTRTLRYSIMGQLIRHLCKLGYHITLDDRSTLHAHELSTDMRLYLLYIHTKQVFFIYHSLYSDTIYMCLFSDTLCLQCQGTHEFF
jgi:hypothetical protein